MLSDKFLARLKTSETPAYRLAQKVDRHPTWLSRVVHGAIRVQPGDPRLIEIGRLLGLSVDEVFRSDRTDGAPGVTNPDGGEG